MKKGFLKFILYLGILLTSVCSSLWANDNIVHTSYDSEYHQNLTSTDSYLKIEVPNQHAILENPSHGISKVFEIEATEAEEEESENTLFKKIEEVHYTSTSLYFVPLQFSLSYLTNSPRFQRLFTFLPLTNRRFVLYQVFRI